MLPDVLLTSSPRLLASLMIAAALIPRTRGRCTRNAVVSRDGQAPKFLDKPSIRQMGDKVMMTVQVHAKPQPEVTWYKESTVISSTSRVRITTESIASATDQFLMLCEITVSLRPRDVTLA